MPLVKPARVECVGPQCGAVVSMATVKSERWIKVVYSDGAKCVPAKNRNHIGWCPVCARKYGVVE
jgi:hypothetical protein